MFYIVMTRESAVEDIFEITKEKNIQEVQQKAFEANQEAGYLRFVTEKNAMDHLEAILAFAKAQKWRADTAEMKLEAAEWIEEAE